MRPVFDAFNEWLQKFPSTNARIIVSIALAAIFILIMTIAIALGKKLDVAAMWAIIALLASMMTIDVVQKHSARTTSVEFEKVRQQVKGKSDE